MTKIRDEFDAFFTDYLMNRDLEKALSHVSENIVSIGTGLCEIAKNKKELRSLMEQEFAEVPDAIHYRASEYMEMKLTEGVYHIFAHMHVTLDSGSEEPYTMECRLTAVCVQETDGWRFVSFHMSTPTEEKEGEDFFPLRYGTGAEQKLSQTGTKELTDIMTRMIPGGIMSGYLEEGFPLYFVNDKMIEMLGYQNYDEFVAATHEMMINTIYEGDRDNVNEIVGYNLTNRNEYVVRYRIVRADGSLLWVEDIGRGIDVNGRRAMVSILHDISDRVDEEERLREEAINDSLTGLYNRMYIYRYIEKKLQEGCRIQLFMIDIDNFKQVNDTRGHVEGDRVLNDLADLFRQNQEEGECYARLGGDEFMICASVREDEEYLVRKIQNIQRQFRERMRSNYPDLEISISVGGISDDTVKEFKELYNLADAEMYRVKKSGKGQLKFNGRLFSV